MRKCRRVLPQICVWMLGYRALFAVTWGSSNTMCAHPRNIHCARRAALSHAGSWSVGNYFQSYTGHIQLLNAAMSGPHPLRCWRRWISAGLAKRAARQSARPHAQPSPVQLRVVSDRPRSMAHVATACLIARAFGVFRSVRTAQTIAMCERIERRMAVVHAFGARVLCLIVVPKAQISGERLANSDQFRSTTYRIRPSQTVAKSGRNRPNIGRIRAEYGQSAPRSIRRWTNACQDSTEH